jgi:deoxycytidine triphosphate deaminase
VFLSDNDIRRELAIGGIECSPLLAANISNSSIDLRLGRKLILTRPGYVDDQRVDTLQYDECGNAFPPRPFNEEAYVSFDQDENGRLTTVFDSCEEDVFDSGAGFLLAPGGFVLGSTIEYTGSKALDILGQISDKSTLARIGLSTFFGAGYIDPGNVLNITLEIKNNGHIPILLEYGMHICQIRFAYLRTPCDNGYHGKYFGSMNTTGAK